TSESRMESSTYAYFPEDSTAIDVGWFPPVATVGGESGAKFPPALRANCATKLCPRLAKPPLVEERDLPTGRTAKRPAKPAVSCGRGVTSRTDASAPSAPIATLSILLPRARRTLVEGSTNN